MNAPQPSRRARLLCGALSALVLTAVVGGQAHAQALPSGGQVAAGQASIGAGEGSVTVTQTSQRAVVNWNQFSVGQGGTVVFDQPGAGSATLNRVTGADPSVIAGAVRANGAVYLINPNGMAITSTGVVDTRGGFIGSTLGMKDSDFMSGANVFGGGGTGGRVLNQGTISVGAGGFVGLLGGRVSNEGVIVAPLGKVALGSGSAATLDLSGDGFLQVLSPGTADDAGQPLVSNSGQISADGGVVALKASTARDAVRQSVNMSGGIVARTVSGHDGSVDLSGGEGGVSTLSGTIDVSGADHGGAVRAIGGTLDVAGLRVDASGASSGGQVELSAHGTLRGLNLTHLNIGAGGALLLDPKNLIIGNSGDSGTPDPATSYLYADGGDPTILWASDLSALLSTGTAVTLQASNDIVWNEVVSVDNPNGLGGDLTLQAGRSIILTGGYSGDGGNFTLIANDAAAHGVIDADRDPGAATIDMSGFFVQSTGGDTTLTMGDGAGVTSAEAGDIATGAIFGGDHLTITGAPSGSGAHIVINGDLSAAHIALTGDLYFTVAVSGEISLSASDVVWTDETTASIGGQGNHVSFIENGVLTRYGELNGPGDAARIALGSESGTVYSKIYGDADPTASGPLVHITAGTFGGDLGILVPDSSLEVTGPGLYAAAGTSSLTVRQGADFQIYYANATSGGGGEGGGEGGEGGGGDPHGVFIDLTPGSELLTITPRGISATTSAASYIYGSPAAVAHLSGVLNNDDVGLNVAGAASPVTLTAAGDDDFTLDAHTAVGSHTVALTGLSGAAAGNYVLDTSGAGPVGAVITPRALTYSCCSAGWTYGAAVPSLSVTFSGILAGDDVDSGGLAVSQAGSPVTLTNRSHAGDYQLTTTGLTGLSAGNYVLSGPGETLTINRRTLTYSVTSANLVYGDLPSYNLTGLLSGDAVTGTLGIFAGGSGAYTSHTSVGAYTVQVSGLAGSNAGDYVLALSGNTNGAINVAQRPLTGVVTPTSYTYGAVSAPLASLSNVVAGDVITPVVTYGGPDAASFLTHANAGAYTAQITSFTGAAASNYYLAGGNIAALAVNPRALTYSYSGGPLTSVYGDAPGALSGGALSGFVFGDGAFVSGVVSATNGQGVVTLGSHTDAGVYSLKVTGLTSSNPAVLASNYTITDAGSSPGQLTITPRPVSYTLGAQMGTYGTGYVLGAGANPGNFASGEAASLTLALTDIHGATVALDFTGGAAGFYAAPAGLDAGAYTLTVTGLERGLGTFKASNYSFAGAAGSLTLSPRTLTYTGATLTSIYGTLATPGAQLNGVFGSDDVRLGAATLNPQGFASIASAPDARTHVGDYDVNFSGLTGAKASNYVLASTGNGAGHLTVVPKLLFWSVADSSAVYGDLMNAGAATLIGVAAGDTITPVVTVSDQHGPVSVGHQLDLLDVGAYSARVTGILGGVNGAFPQTDNYVLAATPATAAQNTQTNVVGILTITPRPVTLKIQDTAADYGFSDNLTFSYAIAQGNFIHAGDLPAVFAGTFTGGSQLVVNGAPVGLANAGQYALTGGLVGPVGNYNVTVLGATLTIDPLHVQYTVADTTRIYGDITTPLWPGAAPKTFTTFAGAPVSAALIPDYMIGVTIGGTPEKLAPNTRVGPYVISLTSNSTNVIFDQGRSHQGQLTISPATVHLNGSGVSAVYGDLPGQPAISGVMFGDDVGVRMDSVTGPDGAVHPLNDVWSSVTGLLIAGVAPPTVGGYAMSDLSLTGPDHPNYVLALPATPQFSGAGSVTVTRRPITITGFGDIASITYGQIPGLVVDSRIYFPGSVTYANLAEPGDGLDMVPEMATLGHVDVGLHGDWHVAFPGNLVTLAGGTLKTCTPATCVASNYVLTDPFIDAHVTVTPKVLTYSITGFNQTGVYGADRDANVILSGLYGGDAMSVDLRLALGSSSILDQTLTGAGQYQTVFTRPPAGNLTVSLTGLSGASAGNYVLDQAHSTTFGFTITPRPITYSVSDATAYAGVGEIAGSMDHFGDYTLNGLLSGDAVGLNLMVFSRYQTRSLADIRAHVETLNPFLDGGDIKPTGLTGSGASNYVIAPTGNRDGQLFVINLNVLNDLDLLGGHAGSTFVNLVQTLRDHMPPDENLPSVPIIGSTISGGTGDGLPPEHSVTLTTDGLTLTAAQQAALVHAGVDYTYASGCDGNGENCVSVLSVNVASFAGALATDFYNFKGGADLNAAYDGDVALQCGSATCEVGSSASADVGLYAIAENVFGASKVEINDSFGAGASVEAGISFAVGGKVGSISMGGSVSGGGAGGEISGGYSKDGDTVSFHLHLEGELGVGFSVDLGASIDFAALNDTMTCAFAGCDHSYVVASDPAGALARQERAAQLLGYAADLQKEEKEFYGDVISGRYNNAPEGITGQLALFQQRSSRLATLIGQDGYSLSVDPHGGLTINDTIPQQVTVVTEHTDGLADIVSGWF
ncbi:MAG: hypothetical protein JWP35_3405 [Caulobacter sp.]|nr:hypothetical protein [Caulobacter sp.]